MLGFGLSKTFWLLFFYRCIQGACNGNIGNFLDISHYSLASNDSKTFSLWDLLFGVLLLPFTPHRWFLVNPAAKWPDTLGKIEILREHPYLLPCLVAGSIAFLSFVFAFFGLKETLPSALERRRNTPQSASPQSTPPPMRELLTKPVLIALTSHGLLYFCNMANDALVPLFFATPIQFGGLGLKPHDIGLILSICGISNALVQAFFGGRIIRHFGARRIFIAGFCGLAVEFAMYMLIGFLARRAGRVDVMVGLALACQLSCTFVIYFSFATTALFIMDAAPSRASLGSVNGLSQMVGTLLRSMAPSFASSLFALSAEHHLVGGNFVYIVLVVVALGAVRCSMLLPRQLDLKK
ncbi:major facilitator superfamily domain-containing protein [Mycena galopus ATCC 62051]|nr:major facilitator superfamily domain-containing protein [Mycena galopus ATCC 62051]